MPEEKKYEQNIHIHRNDILGGPNPPDASLVEYTGQLYVYKKDGDEKVEVSLANKNIEIYMGVYNEKIGKAWVRIDSNDPQKPWGITASVDKVKTLYELIDFNSEYLGEEERNIYVNMIDREKVNVDIANGKLELFKVVGVKTENNIPDSSMIIDIEKEVDINEVNLTLPLAESGDYVTKAWFYAFRLIDIPDAYVSTNDALLLQVVENVEDEDSQISIIDVNEYFRDTEIELGSYVERRVEYKYKMYDEVRIQPEGYMLLKVVNTIASKYEVVANDVNNYFLSINSPLVAKNKDYVIAKIETKYEECLEGDEGYLVVISDEYEPVLNEVKLSTVIDDVPDAVVGSFVKIVPIRENEGIDTIYSIVDDGDDNTEDNAIRFDSTRISIKMPMNHEYDKILKFEVDLSDVISRINDIIVWIKEHDHDKYIEITNNDFDMFLNDIMNIELPDYVMQDEELIDPSEKPVDDIRHISNYNLRAYFRQVFGGEEWDYPDLEKYE